MKRASRMSPKSLCSDRKKRAQSPPLVARRACEGRSRRVVETSRQRRRQLHGMRARAQKHTPALTSSPSPSPSLLLPLLPSVSLSRSPSPPRVSPARSLSFPLPLFPPRSFSL
eukprot:6196299-Pleurochrysis_carterae.AAC.1